MIRLIAALALPLLASACATARFKEPVELFGKAVDLTVSSTKTLQEGALETSTNLARAASGAKPVCWTQECKTGAAGCRIRDTSAAPTTGVKPDNSQCKGEDLDLRRPANAAQKNVLDTIDLVGTYAKRLNKLANAQSVADLEKSVTALQKSLAELGEATGKVTELKTNVPPYAKLFNFFFSNYLQWKQNQALEQAIEAADPAIQQLPATVGEVVTLYYQAVGTEVARLADLSVTRYTQLNKDQNSAIAAQTRVDALREAAERVAAVEKISKADPKATFSKLAAAHQELLKVARDTSVDLSFESLQAFAKSADEANDAFEEIR